MRSGYRAKYDWVVLKPFWLLFFVLGIYYLINREWLMGFVMLFIDYLIGLIASSLHSNISFSGFLVGHPNKSLVFQQETTNLEDEESRIIAAANIKLYYVIVIASIAILIHNELSWYYSIPLSLVVGLISLLSSILIWGMLLKYKGVKNI